MSTTQKREVERKFLLRRMPRCRYDRHFYITQRYTPEGVRYRQCVEQNEPTSKWEFTKTVFTKVNNFERIKIETSLTLEEHHAAIVACTKVLGKTRAILKHDKLQFTVDVILSGSVLLKVAYIGDDLQGIEAFKSEQIQFPKAVQEEVFVEITGVEKFFGFNLALERLKDADQNA